MGYIPTRLADLEDVTATATATAGSILAGDGTGWTELAVGTDGKVLQADSGQPEGVSWVTLALADISDSFTLSDDNPSPVGPAAPGVATESSRADHVHNLPTLDAIYMRSPDGTVWEMTVDNTGAWTSTALSVLLAETGDELATEDGGLLLLE